MFQHILLPSDGSEASERAILHAIEFAQAIGARVSGIHVVPPTIHSVPALEPLRGQPEPEHQQDSIRRILRFIDGTAQDYGVPCECLSVTSDHPFEAIIKTADDRGCDLIWMASHGRRGVAGLLLGSETGKVLAHSPIPVLVDR